MRLSAFLEMMMSSVSYTLWWCTMQLGGAHGSSVPLWWLHVSPVNPDTQTDGTVFITSTANAVLRRDVK